MKQFKETKKFVFTVEGETEKRYLEWLAGEINVCEEAKYKASILAKVCQKPSKFIKSQSNVTIPEVTHVCDIEGPEPEYINKFHNVIDSIVDANKSGKNIEYGLCYSNFTFELWMILHKCECNESLAHRDKYLGKINHAYGENFEGLSEYKEEKNFKRCLSKLTLSDVKSAINRASKIMDNNANNSAKKETQYKGFTYYIENPALTIWEAVEKVLAECMGFDRNL